MEENNYTLAPMAQKIELMPQLNPIASQAIAMLSNTAPKLSSQSLIGITSSICDCVARCKESAEQTRRFEAFMTAQTAAVQTRSHTADQLIQHTFDERSRVIDTYQMLLAKAIETNNTDQIMLAVNALNGLVAQAPAAPLDQVAQIYKGTIAQ